jgi:hypothetical protein
MLKRTLFLLASVTLVMSLQAQDKRELGKKAPVKIEPVTESTVALPLTGGVPTYGPSALTWVAADTMGNCYGTAIGALNPLAFDPWTNTVMVVHRGAATYGTSGQLYYNYSTDNGATWARVTPAVNASVAQAARYPSMTFNNPTKGSDLTSSLLGFSWPELVAGAFGGVGGGADESIGAGSTVAVIDAGVAPRLYSSQVPTFASDNTNLVLWASDNSGDASLKLWKTVDFQSFDTITPPQWESSAFEDGGSITMGGAANNGVLYYAVLGTFPLQTPIQSGWTPGYSKSTDNGATWSTFKSADFRSIPALAAYDRLYDYIKLDGFVSYQGDMNVDKDGFVHFLVQVTDTTIDNNSGTNAVVEIFETANGWDGKVVFSGIGDSSYTKLDGPALGQMGPNSYLAFDKDKNIMVATWNAPRSLTDSLVDVYASYRNVNGGEWSAPVNLTDTEGMNENSHHMAPYVQTNGNGSYTAYVFYTYPAGYTGYFPNGEGLDTQPNVIYSAGYTFTPTGVEDEVAPTGFALSQNYPNPFNPTTSINFTVAQRSNVTLKVYDMLGREVASLVNEVKDQGSYNVNFDAAKLASGTYVYKLTAGNFVETKKMVLLK